jgi:hydroxymethylpyrimidine/phosphomethylpyrimidine kinase
MPQKKYYRALTIAGSDSGGGAGIQADMKTFAALGCYGLSVPVALTAQNTLKVAGIVNVDPDFVSLQIDTVMEDIGVDAIKIGMLGNVEVIRAVAARLEAFQPPNVVLDPVMVAKSGDKLLKDDAVEALVRKLFPLVDVVTPNLYEAEVLLGQTVATPEQMEKAGRRLLDMGPGAVLVKGGHGQSKNECSDCLVARAPAGETLTEWFISRRIDTHNTHGTGCTFSSAIAAYLARGNSVRDSVSRAKEYISGAVEAGSVYRRVASSKSNPTLGCIPSLLRHSREACARENGEQESTRKTSNAFF